MRLPAGFVQVDGRHLVRKGYESEVEGWLGAASPVHPASTASVFLGGRAAVERLTLPDGGRVIVKHYRHGGWLRGLLRDIYWQRPPRSWRELGATEAARRADVLAPEPLAALVLPLAERGFRARLYRAVLVTREITGRVSLGDALRDSTDATEGRAWLRAAVRAVSRLHRAGIRHPDLSVGNFLVAGEPEGEVAILDFDRAVVARRPVGWLGRWAAYRRLSRSVGKLALPALDRRAVATLARAWTRAEPG